MNTNGIYHPSVRMGLALKESRGELLSRVEITYTARTVAGEGVLLSDGFPARAQRELDRAQDALGSVPALGWHVSQQELLEKFQECARGHQLLIV